ncbi:hypothetical protein BLJAPNOD_04709 [Ensifer sp. M14]|uniref:nitrous oxide reductase accessory protein NosL n=1 Tax=Ensifer sp. M14 TaxID=2203782 RepID=UPI000E1D3D3F|nr:nitrous oxide reductase accessory protein NosL [Ensifer sp. M14]RDL48433.1 hypothetical protein BLJAPNOD_04709 [Ensifer sp. M14]
MKIRSVVAVAALLAILSGCQEDDTAAAPAPYSLTEEAMGRYCGMNVLEHPGPKGQIILKDIPEAIWFSSSRDTIAFTMLPEEPKEIAAIYVSDMSLAKTWEQPGADNWVEARKAFFVIDSQRRSGMGADEAVPFSKEADATAFSQQYGGRIVKFDAIPKDYILGTDQTGAEHSSVRVSTTKNG